MGDGRRCSLWQAPLPDGRRGRSWCRSFVDRGGQVIFFPPRAPGDGRVLGVAVDGLGGRAAGAVPVETWRGDQDLLARTQSGAALPVGQLQVRRYCGLAGELTPLATLARRARRCWPACTTEPRRRLLLRDDAGRRRFVAGDQRRRAVRARPAGPRRRRRGARDDPAARRPAIRPATTPRAGRSCRGRRRGALDRVPAPRAASTPSGDRLLAVNRPAAEDAAPVLADDAVAGLFRGLDFARVDDRAGNVDSLIQEIWRLFLIAMLVALVVEAGALPAQARSGRGGDLRMNVSRSLTFLWTPWSAAASALLVLVDGRALLRRLAAQRLPALASVCSSCCGSRSSCLGAVLLNQPEWVEEFRPDEKPAIAVLWDASRQHGDARRARRGDEPTASRRRRGARRSRR